MTTSTTAIGGGVDTGHSGADRSPATPAPTHRDFDVVIVGYGPVGRLLALKLGRRGHRVLVVERQTAVYPLPRAVHMDDETARILQSVDASPAQMPHIVEPYNDFYEWRSADGTPLLRLDWSGRGPSGWNVSNFFYQPAMEAALNDQVEALATVSILREWRATTHTDHGDTIEIGPQTANHDLARVSGRYIVGADGANSLVRSWIGGPITDLGYFHDWLVVDLKPHQMMKVEPPAWQLCDPHRPTTLVPGGPGRRRFEFMRLPHETVQELNREATAWALLQPWGISPDTASLERHTVYTFQARWSEQWRRGRLLLAGDAAHLMPPFAGQGMCSGLRDAANLEWKLDLVLRGLAADTLLDTYGPERAEHVRHFIDASMALGRIICVTDPDEVAARDAAMSADVAAGTEQPPRPLPRLGAGLHTGEHGGSAAPILADAVIAGENRDEICALAWLNVAEASRSLAVVPEGEELLWSDELADHLAGVLAAFNAGKGSASSIARLLIMSRPPGLDIGEITDKGYVNQRLVLRIRAHLVEQLFGAGKCPELIVPRIQENA